MDAHRARVRAELLRERERLLGRHERLEAHLHNADREIPADWQERGAVLQNDEVLEGLESHARGRVAEIEAALLHLEDDDWGVCEDCGDDIAPRRMAAMPTATRCVRCQAKVSP